MSIRSASFEVSSLSQDSSYRLDVVFRGDNDKISRSNPIVFSTQTHVQAGTTLDCFTKNAAVSGNPNKILRGLFQGKKGKEDLDTITQTIKIRNFLKDMGVFNPLKTQNLIVVDFTNSPTAGIQTYSDLPKILQAQEEITNYLTQAPNKFQNLHKALKESLGLEYILFEGPIKYKLVRECGLFNDNQVEFLTSTPAGKAIHCQLAEFIMNGFKFGQVAQIDGDSSKRFEAYEYIGYIGEDSSKPRFTPLSQSIVFLPKEYVEMYRKEKPAPYTQAIQNVFEAQILVPYPASNITVMNVQQRE